MQAAYAHCLALARRHYENFPVASRLLPADLRPDVAVIYAFARRADDIADEGDLPADERLARLDAYASELHEAAMGFGSQDPVFTALADVIERRRLPVEPFGDLLSAFTQDVRRTRYATFAELRDYCRRSADPVGRLLLVLAGRSGAEETALSDAVCTGLQLTNFIQDMGEDFRLRGRIYVPMDEMDRFGVTEEHFRRECTDPAVRTMVDHQITRARDHLRRGAAIGPRLGGRFGLELRAVVEGGLRMLERLERREDAFTPQRLGPADALVVAARALWPFRRS